MFRSSNIIFLTSHSVFDDIFQLLKRKAIFYHSIIIFHFHNNQTSLDVLCDIEVFSVLISFAAVIAVTGKITRMRLLVMFRI